MRYGTVIVSILFLTLGLSACGGSGRSGSDDDNAAPAACADGRDNDADGLVDFPADPGCGSAADNDETDPVALPACSDGIDNDGDGKIDFGAGPNNDPGCFSAADTDETDPVAGNTRTRYQMNNQCWALKSNGNGKFVTRDGTGYAATAATAATPSRSS